MIMLRVAGQSDLDRLGHTLEVSPPCLGGQDQLLAGMFE